jgi:hypothetical protein
VNGKEKMRELMSQDAEGSVFGTVVLEVLPNSNTTKTVKQRFRSMHMSTPGLKK